MQCSPALGMQTLTTNGHASVRILRALKKPHSMGMQMFTLTGTRLRAFCRRRGAGGASEGTRAGGEGVVDASPFGSPKEHQLHIRAH
jgi:hypothetical protein